MKTPTIKTATTFNSIPNYFLWLYGMANFNNKECCLFSVFRNTDTRHRSMLIQKYPILFSGLIIMGLK